MANQPNAAQQQYRWETSGNVLQAVIHAKGIRAKTKAYVRASWNAKTQSPFTDNTTTIARFLRLMDSNKAASIWDALFLKNPDKPRATQTQTQTPSTRTAGGGGGRTGSTVDRKIMALTLGTLRAIRIDTAHTRRAVDDMGNSVDDMADDINDIKSLIMPKKIMARGQTYTDEWGRENAKQSGKIQLAHYNPLAPAESQFLKSKSVTPKGWRKGLTVHGGPTSTPIEKGFMESAIKQAAIQTAILTLKIEKKDREKAELKKKNVYKDPKESDPRVHNDPILGFFTKIDKRLHKIEEMLEDGVGKKGDSLLEDAAEIGLGAGLGAGGAGAAGAVGGRLLGSLGSLGLASIPLAGLWLAKEMAEKAMKFVEGGGNIDTYDGWNPFIQTAKVGRKFADKYNKGREEEWKKKEQKNAAAGRTRGGIASSKGPSMDESIAQLNIQANNPKATEAERAAAARVRDSLRYQRDERAAGVPMGGPLAPTFAETGIPKPTGTIQRVVLGTGKPSSIPAEGMAFLDALSIPESGGRYDAIVGDGGFGGPPRITDFSDHPHVAGVGLKGGKWTRVDDPNRDNWSTAAGRYQITGKTWDRLKAKYGFKDFSPQSQDEAAWNLARDDYKSRTGKNLEDALRSGNFTSISDSLNKTWTSLAGGSEQQPKGSSSATQKRYQEALPQRIAQNGLYHGGGLAPVTRNAALEMDRDSRVVQTASTYGVSQATVTPVVVNNNQQNNTVARRPLTPATTVSKDPSLVRTALRDAVHPVFTS